MGRHYNSMEEELRALKARGDSGMSNGFEYHGRRRSKSLTMEEENDLTVSNWSLSDRDEAGGGFTSTGRGFRKPSGSNASHDSSTLGTLTSGAAKGTVRGNGMTLGSKLTGKTASNGMARGSSMARGSKLTGKATGSGMAQSSRPTSMAAGGRSSGRRGKKTSLVSVASAIILFVVVAFVEIACELITDNDFSSDSDGWEYENLEAADGADTYEDSSPIHNQTDFDYFYFNEAFESYADEDDVDAYAVYLEDLMYDLPGIELPEHFNVYSGSSEGKIIAALTYWSDDLDDPDEELASAFEFISKAWPYLQQDLDDEFGEGAVPLAMSIFDFNTDRPVVILNGEEILYLDEELADAII